MPGIAFYIEHGNEPICRLLVQYGSCPFTSAPFDDDADEQDYYTVVASFQAASFLEDTSVFSFLLGCDLSPASRDVVDFDGNLPFRVLCGQQRVSVLAIMLWVEEDEALLSMVESQSLLPFHVVLMAGANLISSIICSRFTPMLSRIRMLLGVLSHHCQQSR